MSRASALAFVLFFISISALPQNTSDTAGDLARAAQSPYQLHQFIQTHYAFQWEPLEKALGTRLDIGFDCEGNQEWHSCFSEIITTTEPRRVIVFISAMPMNGEYLVFVPLSPDESRWRFAIGFHQFVRYWDLKHRIVSLGRTSYLVTNEQGVSGTGVGSEIEIWRDMAGPSFDPMLSYRTKGHYMGAADDFIRDFDAVSVSTEEGPPASVAVRYNLDFRGYKNGKETEFLELGSRSDTVVYQRNAVGQFTFDALASRLTAAAERSLYGDEGPSCEEFLKNDFAGLKAVASGTDHDARNWLSRYLNECNTSKEAGELKRTLQSKGSR
jgi:hypothetical protein